MALPGNKNFSDYDNYITDQDPTTSAQAQDYFRNQAELLKAVIDCDFWQPETVYQPGDVVKSDSMPNGTEAVMVATKASVTSNVEPQWGAVGGDNISDGACFWKLRWSHWSKEVIPMQNLGIEYADETETKAGDNNSKVVTPFLAKISTQTFALKSKSTNPIASDTEDTSVKWSELGAGVYFLNEVRLKKQPARYGNLTNIIGGRGGLTQFFCAILENTVYFRSGSSDGTEWLNDWVELSNVPVGTIIAYAGNTVPSGFVDCSGAEVNRETYSRLFKIIGTTYGSGNGSTTFNLPNLNNNSFLEGSNTVGTVKSAGLPNASGKLDVYARNSAAYTKPFYKEGASSTAYSFAGSGNVTYTTIGFDMNKANSIYGNSKTVQPKSVTVKFCIKY